MKDLIELYEENSPTKLSDDDAVSDAIFEIITALKTPPVSDVATDARNMFFGESIVAAILSAVEAHKNEFDADTEFEQTRTEINEESGFNRGE